MYLKCGNTGFNKKKKSYQGCVPLQGEVCESREKILVPSSRKEKGLSSGGKAPLSEGSTDGIGKEEIFRGE